MTITQKDKNMEQLEEIINQTIDNVIVQKEREFLSLIKKEEYVKFVQDLFYMCQNEDAKERTYRESFERHPNDFIKFGTIQNSMGKSDAYQKVFYRLKKFIESGEKRC